MLDATVQQDFELDGRIWLNAAYQGPLPLPAIAAAQNCVREAAAPWLMSDDDFITAPERLRAAIAALIGADASDIILGNSASYGVHVLAHGLDWKPGDEVLYVEGEFPASVFPWYAAAAQGVETRALRAAVGHIPTAEELRQAISSRTRVFVCSWVNSFTGHTLDIDAISRVCREAGVLFVLNASQALGARALTVGLENIDAVTCCGYKWLLGPYATGFCWMDPRLRQRLSPPHAYWLPSLWGGSAGLQSYDVRPDLGCREFDVFAAANFLNTVPWAAALEYLATIGLASIERHNAELVRAFIDALDTDRYQFISPRGGDRQSAIIVIRSRDANLDGSALEQELARAGIYTSTRNNVLRLSPHLYNVPQDMQLAAALLNDLQSGG